MIEARVISIDRDPKIMVFETRKSEVLWQKVIHPDDAAFLAMDLDEALRDLRHRMPNRNGD